MNTQDWLSAGILVSMTTGIFSLIISMLNNKKLIQIEKYKNKAKFNQENYITLKNLLDELMQRDSSFIYKVCNVITDENEKEISSIIWEEFKYLVCKFKKMSYMFSPVSQKKSIRSSIK